MYSYEMICWILGFETGSVKKMTKENILIPFFVGGTARSLAASALLPINVVRMRLQMRTYSKTEIIARQIRVSSKNTKNPIHYHGMFDCIKKTYTNEGIRAFYKGLTPLLYKIFPSSGVFFLIYEFTLGVLSS